MSDVSLHLMDKQKQVLVSGLVADSLELFLLNKPTVIVVQHGENLLHVLGALLDKATNLEKLLGAEGVWG